MKRPQSKKEKPRKKKMAKKIYENRKELEKDLRSKEKYAHKKEGKLNEIMASIDEKKKRIDQLYDEKKEILNNIRKLIGEGKDHQKKRDTLHTKISPKRKHVKDFRKDLESLSAKVSRLKKERDDYNRKAKGKLDYLKKQITGQFTTLITMETSLKEEILLYNMILDMQEKIRYSTKGDAAHKQMVAAYNELKGKQEAQWNAYQEINAQRQKAQEEHFASLGKFKEKEKLSREMDVRSDEIKKIKQEINDLYLTIEAVRIAKSRVDKEARFLKRKKARITGDRVRLSQNEKLTLAKEKLKKEKKMGLEDLKLLLSSGTLGGKKDKKRGGRRR